MDERDYTIEELFELLDDVLGKKLAYQPAFTRLGGCAAAGVFLSQLFYWTPKARVVIGGTDGWVWKTAAQWESETGLELKEQRAARKSLLKRGVIEETRAGERGKMHYRVNRRRVVNLLLGRELYEPELSESKRRRLENLALTKRRKRQGEQFVEFPQTENVEIRQTQNVDFPQTQNVEIRQSNKESTSQEITSESTSKITTKATPHVDVNPAPPSSPPSSARVHIPISFPLDDELLTWAKQQCPLVNVEDVASKLVGKYHPESYEGTGDPPKKSMRLWRIKLVDWIRKEQKFEERDKVVRHPSLDVDKPSPSNGGAANKSFAEEQAAKAKFSACPDCFGSGLKVVPGKGATGRCAHASMPQSEAAV